MDIFEPEKRSSVMSKIRNKNTKPEITVRKCLHSLGFRFRLHSKRLPGCPDIVLPKYRTVIFVHGCFWHRHQGCKYSTTPKTHKDFWDKKFSDNVARFAVVKEELSSSGWQVIIVWECEIKDQVSLKKFLVARIKQDSTAE